MQLVAGLHGRAGGRRDRRGARELMRFRRDARDRIVALFQPIDPLRAREMIGEVGGDDFLEPQRDDRLVRAVGEDQLALHMRALVRLAAEKQEDARRVADRLHDRSIEGFARSDVARRDPAIDAVARERLLDVQRDLIFARMVADEQPRTLVFCHRRPFCGYSSLRA